MEKNEIVWLVQELLPALPPEWKLEITRDGSKFWLEAYCSDIDHEKYGAEVFVHSHCTHTQFKRLLEIA